MRRFEIIFHAVPHPSGKRYTINVDGLVVLTDSASACISRCARFLSDTENEVDELNAKIANHNQTVVTLVEDIMYGPKYGKKGE
jgi:hypothetical protein